MSKGAQVRYTIKEMQVNGVDTITDLRDEPPMEITIPFKLEYKQHMLQQGWNASYVAIIPYCFKCKIPLVWHTNPEGNVLFHCPKCNRKWIRGEDWKDG